MSDNDYEIGYGKPPKSGQFKKGKSGNPNGRPKGSKNLKTLVMDEAYQIVEVLEQGKRMRLSQMHLMLKQLNRKAMSGDLKAIDKFFTLVAQYEDNEMSSSLEPKNINAEDQAILDAFKKRQSAETEPISKKQDRSSDKQGDKS